MSVEMRGHQAVGLPISQLPFTQLLGFGSNVPDRSNGPLLQFPLNPAAFLPSQELVLQGAQAGTCAVGKGVKLAWQAGP